MKEYKAMNEKHQHLLSRFFRRKRDAWSQYKDRAEVIWEGKHYVLIRTGMSESRSRHVWMVDKDGLMAPDEDDTPLAQLAGSLVHPVQTERAHGLAEILHDSNEENDEGLFKGRWCKTRRAQCVSYAKHRDKSYKHELPGWIADYERRAAEEKAEEKKQRDFSFRLVHYAKTKLPPRAVCMDSRHDNGIYGTRVIKLGDPLNGFCFEADPAEWRTRLFATRGSGLFLNESQFRRLIDLLAQFAAEEAG